MKSIAAVSFALFAIASARKCTDLNIPVHVSARQGVFDIKIPSADVEVTDFFLNANQQGVNYTDSILTGVCLKNILGLPH